MSSNRRLTEEDDMISCHICFHNYELLGDKLPRIFPCSHTACHKCIESLIRDRRELICPKCRETHRVRSLSGARSFPENPYVVKMVEDLRKRRKEEEKRQAEEKKRQADEEKRRVEEAKRQAEEEKRRVEEAKRQAEEEKRRAEEVKRRAEEFPLCNSHKRELSFQCKDSTCDTTICSLCLVKNHLKHNVIDLIEEHRERLETRIAFLDNNKSEQELVRNKSEDNLKILRDMKNQHMNTFDSMIKDVEINVVFAKSYIEKMAEELKKLYDMKKYVTDTGKAAQKDIQTVQNDVADQAKNNPSCSYLEYQSGSSTDHPCGQLVRKSRPLVTFTAADDASGK